MTYFVRETGNDGSNGLSRSTAWLTITYALGEMSNGDTLIIGAGDYSGADNINLSSLTNIRVLGDVHGTKTGDAGAVAVISVTTSDDAYIEYITTTGDINVVGDWVTLSTCTSGGSIIVGTGCRGCRILTCCVSDSVIATDPDGLELLSLTVLGGGSNAPIVLNSGSGISMRNCIINAVANSYAVYIAVADRVMNFDHNLYWGESGSFAYNGDTGEVFSGIVDWQRTGQDTDSRYEDPMLTSFTPAAGSPAIDMGEQLGITEDKTGVSRYFLQYDMGAVQTVLAQPTPATPSERRFRFQSPLTSAIWIDTLSEFQRWIVHFFGLDTDGTVITQGLAQQLIEDVDTNVTVLSEQIENFHVRIDNINSNVRGLKSRKWE